MEAELPAASKVKVAKGEMRESDSEDTTSSERKGHSRDHAPRLWEKQVATAVLGTLCALIAIQAFVTAGLNYYLHGVSAIGPVDFLMLCGWVFLGGATRTWFALVLVYVFVGMSAAALLPTMHRGLSIPITFIVSLTSACFVAHVLLSGKKWKSSHKS